MLSSALLMPKTSATLKNRSPSSNFKTNTNTFHGHGHGNPSLICKSKPAESPNFRLQAATHSVQTETTGLHFSAEAELMPNHVAVIMDGHGRWAQKNSVPVEHGHRAGVEALGKIITAACCQYRLNVFSLYAFSKENWARSKWEIECLMSIYEGFIRSTVMDLICWHDLRFSVIGTKSRLPLSMQSAILRAENSSKANKGMHFIMGLSYSGKLDIVEASKKIARKVEQGFLGVEDIDEDLFRQHLMTNSVEYPDPDLLIRTSGEMRLSNFMMWQLAYTELYFNNKMFPEFDESDFVQALVSFQCRRRRYGKRIEECDKLDR